MSQPNGHRPIGACDRCGRPHITRHGNPACVGHVQLDDGTERPCENSPRHGQQICDSHGGNARQNVAAAKRRLEAAALEKAVVTYGARREIGHLEAMVELLQFSAGHVVWLRDQIQAQDPQALIWGIADEVNKGSGEFPGIDVRSAAAPSVWLNEYHRERRVLLDVSKELAKLELDWDAREAIRRQGAALARVVREVVRLLGHDPNDVVVGRAFSRALRSVVPGVDPDRVIKGGLA